MFDETSPEDRAALNEIVQRGLAEVVSVEDGQPSYRLAPRFTRHEERHCVCESPPPGFFLCPVHGVPF